MTEAEWNKLLDASPGDRELRRAYATWLQDEADDVAHARFQLWLADEDKWPTPPMLPAQRVRWRWISAKRMPRPISSSTR